MNAIRMLTLACVVAGTMATSVSPAPAATDSRRALFMTVSELNVDGVGVGKAIDYLRDVTGTNIVVNWKTLEAVGVDKTTPISLSVRELPLRKMLQLVLDQASPNSALVYSVDENVIQVTTQEEADKQMFTKVYVVDDLVMAPRRSSPPSLNLGSNTRQGTGGGGSSSGGQSGGVFGQDSNSQQDQNQQTAQQRGDELVTLIREVVRPAIWRENGGTAAIRYFSGKLIVTAPLSVHEAIGGPVTSKTAIRFGG